MSRYAIEWTQTERRPGAPWVARRGRDMIDAPNVASALGRWERLGWCNAEIEAVYRIGRADEGAWEVLHG